MQADYLPAEPQGKPKHTKVGSLSLLQGIFLTQESDQDILHCRHIFHQLSYQGSPKISILCDPMDYTVHGILYNTRVVSHSLLQGIFSAQGSNPGLPHCRQILYQLSNQEAQKKFYIVVNGEIAQLCPTLCDLMDYSPPGSSAMEFPRQEYWSGRPFPSLGDLPNPGIEPGSPSLQAVSLLSEQRSGIM